MITLAPDGTATITRQCGDETCARTFTFFPPANPIYCADCRLARRRRQTREAYHRRHG